MHAEFDRLVQHRASRSEWCPGKAVFGGHVVGLATMNGGEFAFAHPERVVAAESTRHCGKLVVQHGAYGIHHAGGKRSPVG